MSRLLNDLNPSQLEAVTCTEGPLLVVAGAGSGKTRVLTRRLAYILAQRLAQPHEILAVTFTNKAAAEMRERVWELLGGEISQLQVSTFHSFCARFLRREAGALGYRGDFTIYDEADSESLVKRCLKDLGLARDQFPPKGQKRKISRAKDQMIDETRLAASASGYFEEGTAKIYSLYQQRLREFNAMDFDDLLVNAVHLLHDHAAVGEKMRARFQYILVDEYQDTNHVQYLLLKCLTGPHRNLAVVGDEDQSIYGWRGADIRNILEFERDFPGAKVIKLEQNYRSTSVILRAASAVIRHNSSRKDKVLWTDHKGGEKLRLVLVDAPDEEAAFVVDSIGQNNKETSLRQMTILYRINAQSRPLEEQLRQRSIPYQLVGGVAFYQRKEVKDLIAYLKLVANPKDDVAFERVVNFPRRGIGEKTVQQVAQLAVRQGVSSFDIALVADQHPELRARQKPLKLFAKSIEKYREQLQTSPVDLLITKMVRDTGFIRELYREDDEIVAQGREENVKAVIEGAATFMRRHPQAILPDYLAEISLYTDLDSYEETDEKVTLMTIHSAKGLEFHTVFLVGLEEGLLPIARAMEDEKELEEERRLFYVAATRAQRRLYLSSSTVRQRYGGARCRPSRFIEEIPEDAVETLDLRTGHYLESSSGSNRTASPFFRGSRDGAAATGEVRYEFEPDEMFRKGRIVQHPTFGRGRIISTEGYGESLCLNVMFTGLGVKKVMVKYARLKVVG